MKNPTKIIALALLALAGIFVACGPEENGPEYISLADTHWTCRYQKDTYVSYTSMRVYVDSELTFISDTSGSIIIDYFADALESNFTMGDTIASTFSYQISPSGTGSLNNIRINNNTRSYPLTYNEEEQTIVLSVNESILNTLGVKELTFTKD